MTGKNRNGLIFFPVMILISFMAANVLADEILYDDFSTPTIDETKWIGEGVVREIQNGKFVSYVRSFGVDRSAKIAASGSPSIIEAVVTLKSISDSDVSTNCAGIQQAVFNDGSDILAYLNIGRYRGLYMARWLIYDTAGVNLASGNLGNISLNAPYKLRIESDRETGVLVFSVNDESEIVSMNNALEEANNPYFAIGNMVKMDEGEYAFVEATYDNVLVDGEIFDIFSKKYIDEEKWSGYGLETVNEIRNGKLFFQSRNISGSGSYVYNGIRNVENIRSVRCSGSIKYLESDDQALTVFRIWGNFYNTSEDTSLRAFMAIGDISWGWNRSIESVCGAVRIQRRIGNENVL